MSTRAHTVPKFYLGGFVSPESVQSKDPFVWIGFLKTQEIKRRSPKNISIERGLYDGPGGLADRSASIEDHLAKIEWAAASAIRKLAALPRGTNPIVGPEIWRFLAWQAARTPGWMELEQQWAEQWAPDAKTHLVESPPSGMESVKALHRTITIRDPHSGELREIQDDELTTYIKLGWKWVLQSNDKLEMLHMQAWYFQVRHFPSLSWTCLFAPPDGSFVTSDRGVAWLADGQSNTPPAALRHPTAQVFAPLTNRIALVGRNEAQPMNVTPRQINSHIASATSEWIAGASREIVEQAMNDRV